MEEDDPDEDTVLPVLPLYVPGKVLRKMVEFARFAAETPIPCIKKPIHTGVLSDLVGDAWAARVQALDQKTLFDMISAANYLDHPRILDMLCAEVATVILRLTPKEIMAHFGYTNGYSPREEQSIVDENRWCGD